MATTVSQPPNMSTIRVLTAVAVFAMFSWSTGCRTAPQLSEEAAAKMRLAHEVRVHRVEEARAGKDRLQIVYRGLLADQETEATFYVGASWAVEKRAEEKGADGSLTEKTVAVKTRAYHRVSSAEDRR